MIFVYSIRDMFVCSVRKTFGHLSDRCKKLTDMKRLRWDTILLVWCAFLIRFRPPDVSSLLHWSQCALGDCFESHDSLRAVDGDKLPIAEQRHGSAHRHHGRQPHLTGRNRAVGEWTAALRNEAGGAIEERRPGRVRRLGHKDGAFGEAGEVLGHADLKAGTGDAAGA